MAGEPRGHVEREAKLAAGPGFEVPDLTGVQAGVRTAPPTEQVMRAQYHDTDDLRLARTGATVRHRDDRWTVKFPAGGAAAGALHRTEIDVEGQPDIVPDEVTALVRGVTRGAPVVPVAELVTRRRVTALRADDGSTLGEIDDDEVQVVESGEVVRAFREVEAELAPGAPASLLDDVVTRLRAAGAGAPDPTPKLVRALGERAAAAPDIMPVSLGRRPAAGEVVRAAIAASVLRIVEHHHVVRLDARPDGVHQMRVGTRRLRSDLRTFEPLLDPAWSAALRTELGWLADRLGAVRDLDVLAAGLASLADDGAVLAPGDRAAVEPLLDRLGEQRAAALARLHAALAEPRYAALLDQLCDAAREPAFAGAAAARPARRVLPKLARRPWRSLRRAVRALDGQPTDDDMHRIRIRAERSRYAAEAVTPATGPRTARFGRALADLQDVVGEQHDAVVAEQWLRDTVAGFDSCPPATALAAGALLAGERRRAAEGRDAWRRSWRAAARRSPPWSS